MSHYSSQIVDSSAPSSLTGTHILPPDIVLLRYGEEQFEFWRQLIFRVKAVREIYATDATIRMYLNSASWLDEDRKKERLEE